MPAFPLGLLELFVSSQCLLFSVFLLLPSKRVRISRTALGGLLLLLGIHLGTEGAQALGWIAFGVTPVDLFGLLYGPLFLLFVRGLTFRRSVLRSLPAFHFLPFVVGLASVTWERPPPPIYAVAVWLSLGSYLLLSLRTLRRYRRILENTRSDVHRISLSWLRYSIFGLLAIYLLDIGSFLSQRLDGPLVASLLPGVLFGVLLLYVYGFVFAAWRQPRIFEGLSDSDARLAEHERTEGSGEPSRADIRELEDLEEQMVRKKLYLEPQITLSELADALNVRPRRLSELVNGVRGENFSEWVNRRRVKEAKRLLSSDPSGGRSILDILFDSGFNSKSTFNAVFKRTTGMTPTEYRRRSRGN